jgi:serine/threonine protein kinase
MADNDDFITMFIDEAKLAAQLTHNNIIHIYDLGKVDAYHYIAMEYVEGKDLRSILKLGLERGYPLPVELGLFVASKIGNALDYAHTLSPPVIHRDISPSNILISTRGDVKLTDFGVAKAARHLPHKTHQGVQQVIRRLDELARGVVAHLVFDQVDHLLIDGHAGDRFPLVGQVIQDRGLMFVVPFGDGHLLPDLPDHGGEETVQSRLVAVHAHFVPDGGDPACHFTILSDRRGSGDPVGIGDDDGVHGEGGGCLGRVCVNREKIEPGVFKGVEAGAVQLVYAGREGACKFVYITDIGGNNGVLQFNACTEFAAGQ